MGTPFLSSGGGNASTLLNEVNRIVSFADGLGYLTNPLIPHVTKGIPCEEVSKDGLIELADNQVVLIKGERAEIIC